MLCFVLFAFCCVVVVFSLLFVCLFCVRFVFVCVFDNFLLV